MKTILLAAAALAALSMGAARADTRPADSHPMCLESYLVDHTKVVNPSTILFYMRDGKVWRNDLPAPCPGLNFHGFVLTGQQGEVCAPDSISVLSTREVCMLGRFAPDNARSHAAR